MYEVLCDCNWNIPGVEALPYHTHRSLATVRAPGVEELIRIPQHDVALNRHFVVLDQWDEIIISVDWRKVARALIIPTNNLDLPIVVKTTGTIRITRELYEQWREMSEHLEAIRARSAKGDSDYYPF